ncbi:MAG: SDR family oxidoreductase [Anaerolineaceae bacterium]|nr:SDR family oxidoreductase [Anaerolineaceae bacterium]
MKKDIQNRTALVTGASSGLGVDFARELAKEGANLILVARREDRLRVVAAEITQEFGVAVDVIPMDLAEVGAPQVLYDRLKAKNKAVDVLVNNAGFGLHGKFNDLSWEKQRQMLDLDIIALTHLTKLFVPDMVARKFGAVLQVASIAAYQPAPTYASYAGAKSYVLFFSEALDHELRGTGVNVTTVSPGVTATEFLKVAGQQPTLYQRLVMMQSPEVARQGIRALLRQRRSVVPGFFNAFSAFLMRFIPRRMMTVLSNAMMSID